MPPTRLDWLGLWLESRRNTAALVAVLAATLLAKGPAALPGYGIDDYRPGADGPGRMLDGLLVQGRFGHWLFLKTSLILQMEPNEARIFYVAFAILAYSAFGLAVVRFWRVRPEWLAVGAAVLIANHPYTGEIFTYRWGFVPAAMVMAVLSLVLWLAVLPHFHLGTGAIAFAFALSCYPIALHFGLMIVLTSAAIAAAERLLGRASRGAAGQPVGAGAIERRTLRLFWFVAAGTLLYVGTGVLVRVRSGAGGEYFQGLGLPDIPARLLLAIQEIAGTFMKPNVLVPRFINLLFMLLVLTVVLALVWLAVRSRHRLSALGLAASVVILLGLAWLWTPGIFLFLKVWWPTPRSMAHVGVLWAGCAVLVGMVVSSRRLDKVLGAAIALFAMTFIAAHHRMFEDQRQLNLQDLHKANRIIARLEALPGFDQIRRVAFVGASFTYPKGAEETLWKDLNISAFGAWWAQAPILREVSGYALQLADDPLEKAAAAEYCAGVKPWPAPESVVARGELAIVCLAAA